MAERIPLFDVFSVNEETFRLQRALFFPFVCALVGILIIYKGDALTGTPYLLAFFFGSVLASVGIALGITVLVNRMRRFLKERKVAEHMRVGMRQKMFSRFYWLFGIASVAGAALAIAADNENIIGILSGAVLLAAILYEGAVRRREKKTS